jgi:hypothetical protein
VRRGGPKRRFRVRRKRKGFVQEAAEEVGAQIVFDAPGCVIEAIVGGAVLVALLTLPAFWALG